MQISLIIISLLFSVVSVASRYELPQPKTWGPSKVSVFFISPAVQLGQVTSDAVFLKSRAVLKWGTSVFESGTFVFKCKPGKTRCQTFQFHSRGSFEKCLVRNEKIRCFNRLESSDPQTEGSDHHLDNPLTARDSERLEIEGDEGAPVFEESLDDHHLDPSPDGDISDNSSTMH